MMEDRFRKKNQSQNRTISKSLEKYHNILYVCVCICEEEES